MWILMWIKENYNLNTFTDLEFSDFKIFNQIIRSKFFEKGKIFTIPSKIRTDHDLHIRIDPSNPLRYAVR